MDRSELIPTAKPLASERARRAPPSEAFVQLPSASAASELKGHIERSDAELSFAPAEAEAMQALFDVLTARPGEAILETHYMAREAHAFVPLLKPRLGPRFAHLAATVNAPPRDA